jgi:hypothetical protein
MSWLRRIFGGFSAMRGNAADAGYPPLEESKPELFRLLRERGSHSALIEYDGGHDEGSVTTMFVSPEPLGIDPKKWKGDSLPGAQEVEPNWGIYDHESGALGYTNDEERAAGELTEAAMAVVCDRWGSFAGEFEVQGRLVVDVVGERIARHDVMRIDDEESGDSEPMTDVEEV